jgi:hypothetical protein
MPKKRTTRKTSPRVSPRGSPRKVSPQKTSPRKVSPKKKVSSPKKNYLKQKPLWRDVKPHTVKERKDIVNNCGDNWKDCFLIPSELKYPICEKNKCQPTCQGIASAKARARLVFSAHGKHKEIYDLADEYLEKYGC